MSYQLFKKTSLKFILSASLLTSSISYACINDADSRFFEQQQFPSIMQLISADFPNRTKESHIWRIEDRLKKINKEPNNWSYYDDLSVSYEKTGQTKKAIETLEKIYEKNYNRYETLANLGTFYIHNQQYKKGLDLLKKAIVINPDAHFGREIYQIKIVEYLLQENPSEKITFPIQKGKESFAQFILKDLKLEGNNSNNEDFKVTELLKAIVGVGGMLKFGNSDSPILLEAMGDLYTELNHIHSQYQIDYHETKFGKYALLFYASAIKNIKSETGNEDKFNEYLKIKKLTTTAYLSSIFSKVEYQNSIAEENREKHKQKEIEIINQGGDVEKNIYDKLYSESKIQPDLFESTKKDYLEILSQTKDEYIWSLKERNEKFDRGAYITFILFSSILGLFYLYSSPVWLSFIFNKFKIVNSENLKDLKSVVKGTITIILFYLLFNTINLFYVLKWI